MKQLRDLANNALWVFWHAVQLGQYQLADSAARVYRRTKKEIRKMKHEVHCGNCRHRRMKWTPDGGDFRCAVDGKCDWEFFDWAADLENMFARNEQRTRRAQK